MVCDPFRQHVVNLIYYRCELIFLRSSLWPFCKVLKAPSMTSMPVAAQSPCNVVLVNRSVTKYLFTSVTTVFKKYDLRPISLKFISSFFCFGYADHDLVSRRYVCVQQSDLP